MREHPRGLIGDEKVAVFIDDSNGYMPRDQRLRVLPTEDDGIAAADGRRPVGGAAVAGETGGTPPASPLGERVAAGVK